MAGAIGCIFLASCKKEETEISKNKPTPVVRTDTKGVTSDDNPKRIKGKIKSALTSEPVEAAEVYLYDEYGVVLLDYTLSNDTGGFFFEDVYIGDYDLEVLADGYDEKLEEITVPLAGEEYNVGDIYLQQ